MLWWLPTKQEPKSSLTGPPGLIPDSSSLTPFPHHTPKLSVFPWNRCGRSRASPWARSTQPHSDVVSFSPPEVASGLPRGWAVCVTALWLFSRKTSFSLSTKRAPALCVPGVISFPLKLFLYRGHRKAIQRDSFVAGIENARASLFSITLTILKCVHPAKTVFSLPSEHQHVNNLFDSFPEIATFCRIKVRISLGRDSCQCLLSTYCVPGESPSSLPPFLLPF